jgi:hypothetical protein
VLEVHSMLDAPGQRQLAAAMFDRVTIDRAGVTAYSLRR